MPTFSDDDYIQWCVEEAIALRIGREEKKAEDARKIREWQEKPLGSGAFEGF